jgi:hypothetical protein
MFAWILASIQHFIIAQNELILGEKSEEPKSAILYHFRTSSLKYKTSMTELLSAVPR